MPLFYVVTSHQEIVTPEILHADEHALLEGASAKRINEFCAGRYCAHQVLAQLGYPNASVLKDQHGAPVWPKGIVGSISHSGDRAIAVVAKSETLQAIGVDIQHIHKPFPNQTWVNLFRNPEIHTLLNVSPERVDFYAYSLFSAKESVQKCCYGAVGAWLDLTDINISLDIKAGHFAITLPTKPWLNKLPWHGRIQVFDGYIVTLVWVENV